ncbi:MAG TPA: YdeI/OmpD-associated family protein [Planctomycetota bacterium]
MPARLPAYIEAALRKNAAAKHHFDALSPSQRRRYYAWIESAMREETKLRRLEQALRLLASGKELGLR